MSSPTSDDSANSELTEQVLGEFRTPASMRSIAQLYDALSPRSFAGLQAALSELLRANKLKATFRIHSPYGDDRPGFDFPSILAVPETLMDDFEEPPQKFVVGLADLEVLFSLSSERVD